MALQTHSPHEAVLKRCQMAEVCRALGASQDAAVSVSHAWTPRPHSAKSRATALDMDMLHLLKKGLHAQCSSLIDSLSNLHPKE